jgi:hypothetical protein
MDLVGMKLYRLDSRTLRIIKKEYCTYRHKWANNIKTDVKKKEMWG